VGEAVNTEPILLIAAAVGASVAAFLDHLNHRRLKKTHAIIQRIDVRVNGYLEGLEGRLKALERKR
jgi:hypothetical protein